MAFSTNWFGIQISRGERFVVSFLDRAFGGRSRRIVEVNEDGLEVDGDLNATGDLTANGATPGVMLCTDEIDLTVTGTYLFKGSVQPGKRFVVTTFGNNSKTIYTATAGSVSVHPLGTMGSNAPDYDNYTLSTPFAITDATGFAAGAGAFRSSLGLAVTPVTQDLATGIYLKVTTPASGTGLTLKGKVFMFGAFIPVP